MRHVDLCSGIGGFALGFEWAGLSHPVLFCDIEPWSRQVLAKHWPDVPISDDVKELASDAGRLVPDCDILTAGYPCQPFSVAGQQRGAEDDRHIWPEIFAIVQEKLPRWCVFENVSGHITLGLDQVLSDLEGEGYAIQPFVIPACAVDAPHRRDRVWIVAHADSDSEPNGTGYAEAGKRLVGNAASKRQDIGAANERKGPTDQQKQQFGVRCEPSRPSENVADTNGEGLQGHFEQQAKSANTFARYGEDVADTKSQRIQGHRAGGEQVAHAHERQGLPLCGNERYATAVSQSQSCMGGMADGLSTWLDEPRDIPRVATGVKQRAARLKGLGNAIVPQIAMNIGLTIKAVEDGQV